MRAISVNDIEGTTSDPGATVTYAALEVIGFRHAELPPWRTE